MKEHFCPAEQSIISYQDQCNWCGEQKPDDIASILTCRDMLDAQPVPPRTWVDLTDEEIDNINYTSAHMLAREVLAKFKEKNT